MIAVYVAMGVLTSFFLGLWLHDHFENSVYQEQQRELDRQIRAAIKRSDQRERARKARELGWN